MASGVLVYSESPEVWLAMAPWHSPPELPLPRQRSRLGPGHLSGLAYSVALGARNCLLRPLPPACLVVDLPANPRQARLSRPPSRVELPPAPNKSPGRFCHRPCVQAWRPRHRKTASFLRGLSIRRKQSWPTPEHSAGHPIIGEPRTHLLAGVLPVCLLIPAWSMGPHTAGQHPLSWT